MCSVVAEVFVALLRREYRIVEKKLLFVSKHLLGKSPLVWLSVTVPAPTTTYHTTGCTGPLYEQTLRFRPFLDPLQIFMTHCQSKCIQHIIRTTGQRAGENNEGAQEAKTRRPENTQRQNTF